MTESRKAFVRLANARVHKALKQIELIGNLSNGYRYEYTVAEVQEIFRALDAGLAAARKRFEAASSKSGVTFKLKE